MWGEGALPVPPPSRSAHEIQNLQYDSIDRRQITWHLQLHKEHTESYVYVGLTRSIQLHSKNEYTGVRQVNCNCAQLCLVGGPHLPFFVLLLLWGLFLPVSDLLLWGLFCRTILTSSDLLLIWELFLSGHAYLFPTSSSEECSIRSCLPLPDLLLLWGVFYQVMLTFV